MSKSQRNFYAQVAVPVPLRQTFDYLTSARLSPGSRVLVPFGRRNVIGIVISSNKPTTDLKLKSVKSVLDTEPAIDPVMLRLLEWAANYYHYPLGEVLSAALPAQLRKAGPLTNPATEIQYSCVPNLDLAQSDQQLTRAPRQKAIFELIKTNQWISSSGLRVLAGASPGANLNGLLKSLESKNLITQRRHSPELSAVKTRAFSDELTQDQRLAIDSVNDSLGQFASFVLHGITGSGKTEVYLHVAEQCISRGQQILILVPEIALTPQLVSRFSKRFGERVGVIHSRMTTIQRFRTWWNAREGIISIVLGTRSAVFTPLKNLGVIVIDEEHDISLKQQDGFRYHARDLAIKRASLENIPIILGSATPSMESIFNVEKNRHQLLVLSDRIGNARLPKIDLVDLKDWPLQEGLSRPLIEAIESGLENQQQTILYINRRGFAPIAQCASCHWKAGCDRCTAFLTYHKKSATFRCHHCGKIISASPNCTQCASPLFYAGVGTQRIEKFLRERFSGARISRFDRDEITTQRNLEQALNQINQGEIDIVIGTQLITKGHDFPGVTLVGVIDADQGLYSCDFRATESLFQQLVQVAGRAGRGGSPGRVIIQTAHPDNIYLELIKNHDFEKFYKHNLQERKLIGLPPFGYIALWRAESTNANAGMSFLQTVSKTGGLIVREHSMTGIQIMDPVTSPMEKLAGRYRVQLLVKATQRKPLHQLLSKWIDAIQNSARSKNVRWSVDIDAMEMY